LEELPNKKNLGTYHEMYARATLDQKLGNRRKKEKSLQIIFGTKKKYSFTLYNRGPY